MFGAAENLRAAISNLIENLRAAKDLFQESQDSLREVTNLY